jgi:plasmid stabilization system protein ParE
LTPRDYVLSDAAEADLREIIRYTLKQWSDAQVRRYASELQRRIARLAAGQGSFRDMSEIYPALRVAHCEHHYVFCLPREHTPALIVAILHERMDLMARLANRLKESG